MPTSNIVAIDTTQTPWEERFNEKIGRALFRKELFSDPEAVAGKVATMRLTIAPMASIRDGPQAMGDTRLRVRY